MKEYEKAAETYEAGMQHDPNNAELKDGIARCMEAVNKVKGTSQYPMQAVHVVSPQHPNFNETMIVSLDAAETSSL